MLIPLRHENMEGRRWPVVTFALIAINVLVFLGTHWTMEAQSPERTEVRTHLILLAATHPELNMPYDVDQFIAEVQKKIPAEIWKQIANPNRKSEDAWDAHIRTVTDRDELQAEMDSLAQRFAEQAKLEHQANAVIEDKIGWTADPAIVQGTESMEKGKFDEGIAVLKKHIAVKPDAIDAQSLLRQLYWRKQDVPAHLESTIKLCQLHIKAQDTDAALEDYQEYNNAGGDRMPAATWLELCRIFEGKQDYPRAVEEYEHLSKAFPTERPSLLALLSAGRLSLKQLNRPADALVYYKAASASSVPHLDWDSNIQTGIQAAEKLLTVPATPGSLA